ncbi:hypothetical protein DPMN_091449 [Dreissena polymorpha]|uniref:Uncharacterized protein n=1 Tax=Dreissena polymorpha TaxID=45954 RepID=A0A9D4R0Q7_DREPO|nr:hypothetical protein DPMN_091449 [Dreissena polymorpha]
MFGDLEFETASSTGTVQGCVFFHNVYCRITTRVRKLLMLIPTDPAVIDALDSMSTRVRE